MRSAFLIGISERKIKKQGMKWDMIMKKWIVKLVWLSKIGQSSWRWIEYPVSDIGKNLKEAIIFSVMVSSMEGESNTKRACTKKTIDLMKHGIKLLKSLLMSPKRKTNNQKKLSKKRHQHHKPLRRHLDALSILLFNPKEDLMPHQSLKHPKFQRVKHLRYLLKVIDLY